MTSEDAPAPAWTTCRLCGAVVGDALRHRRWHVEEAEQMDAAVDVLRPLVEDLDRRAREP